MCMFQTKNFTISNGNLFKSVLYFAKNLSSFLGLISDLYLKLVLIVIAPYQSSQPNVTVWQENKQHGILQEITNTIEFHRCFLVALVYPTDHVGVNQKKQKNRVRSTDFFPSRPTVSTERIHISFCKV